MNKLKCIQCYQCQEWGTHTKPTCAKFLDGTPPVCSKCSEPGHIWQHCNNTNIKCHNCGGPHPSSARCCTFFKNAIQLVFKEAMEEESWIEHSHRSSQPSSPTSTTSAAAPWVALHTAVHSSLASADNPEDFYVSLFARLKAASRQAKGRFSSISSHLGP